MQPDGIWRDALEPVLHALLDLLEALSRVSTRSLTAPGATPSSRCCTLS